jgi:hypothetical protein
MKITSLFNIIRPFSAEVSAYAVEGCIAIALLYGADAFGHLKMTVSGFVGLILGWLVGRGLVTVLRIRGNTVIG